MARKFTIELISQYIKGITTVSSSTEHSELLGSADELIIQTSMSDVSAGGATLTVVYQHCNDGKLYKDKTTIFSGAIAEGGNEMSNVVAGSGTHGRVLASFANNDHAAFVRITACGRVY